MKSAVEDSSELLDQRWHLLMPIESAGEMNLAKCQPVKPHYLKFLIVVLLQCSWTGVFAAESSAVSTAAPTPTLTTFQRVRSACFYHVFLGNSRSRILGWARWSNQAWLKFESAFSNSHSSNAISAIDLSPLHEDFALSRPAASEPVTSSIDNKVDAAATKQAVSAEAFIRRAERTFPPDSGMVNVKSQYGARGDGVSDDTAAIQLAISATVHHPQSGPRIIFFPAGTYLVSRPLLEKDLKSQWNSLLTLQGENRAATIIRLRDNDPLYQSTSAPADVLEFASQNARPNGGGNSAFDNNIFDMTIDVGRGNPGAVALDFLGNNYCALRNVSLQSSDPNHSGVIGLALQRYASGPCFMKNVTIDGFDYGVKVANNEYSLTFENLALSNQRRFGIYNANNVLAIRHLLSTNNVPAIYNANALGLVTLVGALLQGGSSQTPAILNHGTLYARDVTSSGYASALQGRGSSITEYDSGPVITQFGVKSLSLNLPVEETPSFEESDLSNWKSVTFFGADPTGRTDSSAAIQAAINSGATTVYFPTGTYLVTRTVLVGGKVRMLEGFDSSLNPGGEIFSRTESPAPLLKIVAGAGDLTLDHFRIAAYYPHPVPGVILVQQDSARPLVMRDSVIGGLPSNIAYQNTKQGSGTLFIENVTAGRWQILFPQSIFARQINPEANTTKIVNKGGKLWILGLKTEGTGTNIETEQGGSTEVLGGLIYPVRKTATDSVNFVVNDSYASFIYAVSNYRPIANGGDFAIQVKETHNRVAKSVLSASLPARGLGIMMPLYSSGSVSPDSNESDESTDSPKPKQ